MMDDGATEELMENSVIDMPFDVKKNRVAKFEDGFGKITFVPQKRVYFLGFIPLWWKPSEMYMSGGVKEFRTFTDAADWLKSKHKDAEDKKKEKIRRFVEVSEGE